MTWGKLLAATGSLIQPPETKAVRHRMNDGRAYSVEELHDDRRNTERLALSTLRHRIASGETDIERIWQRRPKALPGRQNRAANTPFNRDGLPT